MENYKWIDGFTIASKLYYKLGHLDLDEHVATNSGFPIGKWLQWNRDNIGSLNLFDIYNLSSMGMIWSKHMLGHHRSFAKNYERLKKYKRIDEKIKASNIKEQDLRKWANDLILWRKLEDNAFLTLREVDMLDEIGFDWGAGFNRSRKDEENSRKNKIELYIDGMRKAYSENTKVVYRDVEVKPKASIIDKSTTKASQKTLVQRVEVPVPSNKWHDILIESYLGNTAPTDGAITAYKTILGKGKAISNREAEFVKFLSRGNNGLALWLIKKRDWIEIPSLIASITELKEWVESLSRIGIEAEWSNEQFTLNGYNVASLVYRVLTEFDLIESGGYSIANKELNDYIANPYMEMQKKSPIRFLGKIIEFKQIKGLPQLEDFRKLYVAKKEKDAIEKRVLKEREKSIKKAERMRIKDARDKAKKELLEKQKREKENMELRHKKEQYNIGIVGVQSKLINFDQTSSVTRAVAVLREAIKTYEYIPFNTGEIDNAQLDKVIMSLNNYGLNAFDADTIYRFEKNGYIFYDGEVDEELIAIKKIFCKFIATTLDGHDVRIENVEFAKLSNNMRRITDKTTREFISGQLYENADCIYPIIGEFKAAIKGIDKNSKKYEAVRRMKNVIKEKISAKRYIT